MMSSTGPDKVVYTLPFETYKRASKMLVCTFFGLGFMDPQTNKATENSRMGTGQWVG